MSLIILFVCACEVFSFVAATRSIAAFGMLCAATAAAVGYFLSAFNSDTFYWFDLNVLWVWARACWAFISAFFFSHFGRFPCLMQLDCVVYFHIFFSSPILCQTEDFEFDQNQNAIKCFQKLSEWIAFRFFRFSINFPSSSSSSSPFAFARRRECVDVFCRKLKPIINLSNISRLMPRSIINHFNFRCFPFRFMGVFALIFWFIQDHTVNYNNLWFCFCACLTFFSDHCKKLDCANPFIDAWSANTLSDFIAQKKD